MIAHLASVVALWATVGSFMWITLAQRREEWTTEGTL